MKRYSHLFFDLDRTLWDFQTNSRQALQELYLTFELESRGISNVHDFILKFEEINESLWAAYRMGNLHKRQLRSMRFYKTMESFGCKDERMCRSMGDMYIEISPVKTGLFPNTHETLDYLAGNYRMHIITNGFEEVQHLKLKNAGLTPYFDLIMTSELASARKPDPVIFQLAMQKVGASAPDALMIGDDLIADIGGARSLWMDQVFFNPEGLLHEEEITYEIKDLIELKAFL